MKKCLSMRNRVLLLKLRELKELNDSVYASPKADCLLMEWLEDIGYGVIVKAYEEV